MTEQFQASPRKGRGLGKATLDLRRVIMDVLSEINGPATVRQIYYLVSVRNGCTKDDAGYNRVQRQVLAMRREGLIHYHRIADNVRRRIHPMTHDGLADALEYTAGFYRQAVWRDLPVYLEVWTEKDALAGVLAPVTQRYDIPLMVARGYTSESFAWAAAEEMRDAWDAGKVPHVIYIGDHDPSGWHMAEDLESKLRRFIGRIPGVFESHSLFFQRLAVSPEQIGQWDLPTRPTKRSDTRVRAFEKRFGKGAPSCEVDAIHPDVLRRLLVDAIEQHLPAGALEKIQQEEEEARRTLHEIAEVWRAA